MYVMHAVGVYSVYTKSVQKKGGERCIFAVPGRHQTKSEIPATTRIDMTTAVLTRKTCPELGARRHEDVCLVRNLHSRCYPAGHLPRRTTDIPFFKVIARSLQGLRRVGGEKRHVLMPGAT